MIEKARIVVERTGQQIPVMYNPEELAVGRSVEVRGEGSNVQFLRVRRDQFTVSLFFDTSERRSDVREQTRQLEALLKPVAGQGERKEPPVCLFNWSSVWFRGLVSRLQQRFTLFLPSGIPVRARVEVTFKSVLSPQEELESLGVSNSRKLWRVDAGDRLDLLAHRALGDAALWRLIAEANEIDDPAAFPSREQVGTVLVIPDNHA